MLAGPDKFGLQAWMVNVEATKGNTEKSALRRPKGLRGKPVPRWNIF